MAEWVSAQQALWRHDVYAAAQPVGMALRYGLWAALG